MEISEKDFQYAIKLANNAGQRGHKIDLIYIPPKSASQITGIFVMHEYTRNSATEG